MFLDKWLLPIAMLPSLEAPVAPMKDGARILEVQERALDMIARLPFGRPIAAVLEAQYNRHSTQYWHYKKIHKGKDAGNRREGGDPVLDDNGETELEDAPQRGKEGAGEGSEEEHIKVAEQLAYAEVSTRWPFGIVDLNHPCSKVGRRKLYGLPYE